MGPPPGQAKGAKGATLSLSLAPFARLFPLGARRGTTRKTEIKQEFIPRPSADSLRNRRRVVGLTTNQRCVYVHTMHSREVIAALEAAGWREVTRKGSHVQFSIRRGPAASQYPTRNAISRLGRFGALKDSQVFD